MQDKIIQSNPKQHLGQTTTGYDESHLHALNDQNLNTLIIGDKITKEKFPMFNANLNNDAGGIIQINKQLKTFNNQVNLLNLMGDSSGKAEQIGKIVSTLSNSRDAMIKKMEQTSLVLKGTQFFNTTDLEDIVLINNKGLANMSDDEFKQAQRDLFDKTHGPVEGMPSHEEMMKGDE